MKIGVVIGAIISIGCAPIAFACRRERRSWPAIRDALVLELSRDRSSQDCDRQRAAVFRGGED